jgi:hypothetical protein
MTSCQTKDVDVETKVEYVCGGREFMVHKLGGVSRKAHWSGPFPFGQVTAGVDRANLQIMEAW